MADAPNRYDDPYYTQLASATEQKLGLPIGLLSSIVTKGEKSNADQVSEAGARTVFQITPGTRRLVLDRDGIDAYLSPENAAEVAGLVAKDGVNWASARTKDPAAIERMAAGYYHAGGDTANWGPKTNSYMARVTAGMQTAKADALDNDFASFMASNPAVPPAGQRPQPAAAPGTSPVPATDALSQDFAAWKADQDLNTQYPNRDYKHIVPGQAGVQKDEQGRPFIDTTPNAPPTIGQQIVGAGEAALAGATGVVAYPAALAAGAGTLISAAANQVAGGPAIDPDSIGKNADAMGAALTYAPRTDAGQQMTQAAGEALQPLAGLAPAEAAALHSGAAPIVQAVKSAARAAPAAVADVVGAVKSGAGAVADAAGRVVDNVRGKTPEAAATPGTMASGGAAGTDIAAQRTALGQSMDVPIDLTKGQATRDFEQQRFEKETQKDPGAAGGMLRDRAADQNGAVQRNFDVWMDKTGAEAPDLRGAGMKVVAALRADAAKDKAEIKAAYNAADAAGETAAPVSLNSVVQYLNDNAPEAVTAPILKFARAKAIQLGIAREENGVLVANAPAIASPIDTSRGAGLPPSSAPGPGGGVTLKRAELFRKAINAATDYEPTNIRQSSILKGAIDSDTEGVGGPLYQQARRLYENAANRYQNNAVIAKLMNNKRGTNDRQVAFEDVWKHTIGSGSLDDVRTVRKVLQTGGEDGQQAWRELQGRTLAHLKEAATQNAQMDVRGQPVVSPAGLNKAIKSLDQDGKLDFIFGKQGAQKLRDVNELSQVMFTAPAGSVNTSNTASVVLAALAEAGATGVVTGLPVPLVSLARIAKNHHDQTKLRARVQDALNGGRTPAPARINP